MNFIYISHKWTTAIRSNFINFVWILQNNPNQFPYKVTLNMSSQPGLNKPVRKLEMQCPRWDRNVADINKVPVIKTANIVISSWYFTEFSKEIYSGAHWVRNIIIFPHYWLVILTPPLPKLLLKPSITYIGRGFWWICLQRIEYLYLRTSLSCISILLAALLKTWSHQWKLNWSPASNPT